MGGGGWKVNTAETIKLPISQAKCGDAGEKDRDSSLLDVVRDYFESANTPSPPCHMATNVGGGGGLESK